MRIRGSSGCGAAAALAALAFWIAAHAAPPIPADEKDARLRADESAEALMAALMPRLATALQEGGPPEGIRVCSEIAQTVTRELGAGQGVVVKRTSLRTRNPANDPEPWERAWLESAQAAIGRGDAPAPSYEVVELEGGTRELRHLRAIVYPGGLCDGCHGPDVPAEVRALLAERYPKDRATGFRPGDLRGAISVRVPLAAARSDGATPEGDSK